MEETEGQSNDRLSVGLQLIVIFVVNSSIDFFLISHDYLLYLDFCLTKFAYIVTSVCYC